MFMLRSTVIVAIASVLFVYFFPWTLFFGRATTASVQPFTSNIPGWHHPRAYAPEGVPGGSRRSKWHIHDYLGGNGPWINRADANNEDIRAPPGCEIVQVHMLSRHNERYPTMKAGLRLLRLLEKLYNANVTLSGDLNFLYDWTFFSSDPQKDFDQLTSSGPFAGTLGAFTTGVKIRTRYTHLFEEHMRTNRTLNLWAGDSRRVIETAQHLAAGMFGLDWRSQATLLVVPEDFSTGGNTLTPGKACPKYQQDLEHGREGGYAALARFTDATFGDTAGRLQKFIRTAHGHNVQLTTVDVYAMQELCGFDIMTRGVSPWCDVFTPEEWERFAYARDLLHFYRAGPGGKYSHAMGHIYLNATSNLMLQGPDAGSMFFSFVHDGDIIPVLAALHVFDDEQPLPIAHIKPDRNWKTSRLTPMGGRIIFELLHCNSNRSTDVEDGMFVRININDGVVPIPDCNVGAQLCPLQSFSKRLSEYQHKAGDFRGVCGLGADMPRSISFLHQ